MDIGRICKARGRTPFALLRHPCEQRLPRSFIKLSSSSSASLFSCKNKNIAALTFNSNSDSRGRRHLCGVSNSWRSRMDVAPLQTAQVDFPISETFFRNALASMEKTYLSKNLTVSSVLDFVRTYDGGQVCYDHFAFRTFNVDNCGISALAQFFLDFGYITRGELSFPGKHLRALWFSPPQHLLDCNGEGVNGPLPRIFISELLVDKLSPESQAIIKKYTSISSGGSKYAALASVLGSLTWPTPLLSDYHRLARESEYAAWTLVNGYALNHLTISVHRLKSDVQKIGKLNELIQSNKFKLNTEGGILKVSPDGRLLQSSTVADSMVFHFAEGISESVPASYIEFAERLVLPEYENLSVDKILELHRRDGFEVGNADKIFESTSAEQLRRKVA
uniref:2-oxoadipate dioxygenase/decarboxylase n=1 Tax=Picea sitchensis TaxID=3332 RepID=A9NZB2_PICSI|nr:unknown [Picea sitchensis]